MASLLSVSMQIPYPPEVAVPTVHQTHVKGLVFKKKPDSTNALTVHANPPDLWKLPQV